MFRKEKKLNRKAFTMVELLGVMVIIGVISTVAVVAVSNYFDKSRAQKDEQNKNNVIMAAQSYYQANRDLLPKVIGDASEINLSDLRKAKYLSGDVSNSKDESCMEKSFVRVVKLDNDYYSYYPQLYCGDEERPPLDTDIPKPTVDGFKFYDKSGNTNTISKLTNVRNARFTFTMKGSPDDEDIKIYSYSYSILVKDNSTEGLGDDGFIEVFNSGTVKGNNQHEITIKSNQISKYVDVTGKISVKVRVYVMNDQGMYRDFIYGDTAEGDSSNQFEDTIAPLCGEISGDAQNDDEWTNKSTYESGSTNRGNSRGYPSVVTVLCDDAKGSGCKRNDFSRSWPTKSKNDLGETDYNYGARWGYIVIEDNAVNTTKETVECSDNEKFNVSSKSDEKNVIRYCNNKGKEDKTDTSQNGNQRVCFVRVNVDVQAPSIKARVYKNGTKEEVASIEINDFGPTNTKTPEGTIKSTDYKNAVGEKENEKWLNLENYPDGIELEADVADNLYVHRWTWETSDAYLPFSTPDTDLVTSALSNTDKMTNENGNAKADGSKESFGEFTKEGVNGDLVDDITKFKNNEHGTLEGKITGIKLTLEGKRYGRLTVYDKAGNPTILHVYANIDRTPPKIPDMSHTKIGHKKAAENQAAYVASNSDYTAGDDNNYSNNENWSREEIKTYVDGQREDRQVTDKGENKSISGDLSGWWKFKYEYELQDPNKKRYTWQKKVELDGEEDLEFKTEGTHKVRALSCDNAHNCSDFSKNNYIKIDYTLPTCDFKETFEGVSGCTEALTCKSKSCTTSTKTCYNEFGWLGLINGVGSETNPADHEKVTLSHVCGEENSEIASKCNETSQLNNQSFKYDFNIDVVADDDGKNGGGANGYRSMINPENFQGYDAGYDESVTPAPQYSAGGHVIDYAGNIRECDTKNVRIDYKAPMCDVGISYGIDGEDNDSIHPKNPEISGVEETGWLSLYKGDRYYANSSSPRKETAKVYHICEDEATLNNLPNVSSGCNPDSLRHTIYNWELRTTSAGALGIGQGGFVTDYADNITNCPANKTINIDYTQPKCNTIIEYPQGAPINQKNSDIESGWLGYNDNVNCKNGVVDSNYRNGGSKTGNNTSSITGGSNLNQVDAPSSNIKGDGNVPKVTHKAYLNGQNGNSSVTRAEYAKIICDAVGIDYSNITYDSKNKKYTDVDDKTNNWKAILAATNAGLFQGVGNNKFSPNTNLKRAELVVSIMRAAVVKGVSSPTTCTDVQFNDVPSDSWYAEDIRAAANNCYFKGTSLHVSSATADASIAQIATVIFRAFRENDENNCVTSNNKKFDANSYSGVVAPDWAHEAMADANVTHTCSKGTQGSSLVEAGDEKTFDAYIDQGTLNSGASLTRQEFAKMLYNAAQITPSHGCDTNLYTDVKNNVYCEFITEAKYDGIMIGTNESKGLFNPTGSITRAQIITAMMRFMEKHNLSTGKTCSPEIPDVEDGKWYSEDMKKAASMCLLVGDNNGFFHPNNVASISETTAILFRAFRDEKGLDCKLDDGTDYDNYMPTIPGVSANSWQYEYLKNATTKHTCTGTIVDPGIDNNITEGNLPDTSCDQLVNEKKTAVITQVCSEQGNTETQSGCYGSLDDSENYQNEYRSKTYDQTMQSTRACSVDKDGNCGYIVDKAGNVTNCSEPNNFHTVQIDYERPSCKVETKYSDRRLSKAGNYDDGHWMGKNSSATISSLCSNDTGGSNCWEEKNSKLTYSSEIKAVNIATSKRDFKDAYVYDLAGNRSQEACPKKTVQIDHTGPVCKTIARYFTKGSTPTADTASDTKSSGEYKPTKKHSTINQNYPSDGWINGNEYSIRVISYCEKDDAKNVKAGGNTGSGCKGSKGNTPSDHNNQRSYNDYSVSNGQILNGPKGAKGTKNTQAVNDDFYEHKAFSVSGIKRIDMARAMIKALNLELENGSIPFNDVNDADKSVVSTVYSNGLMEGVSSSSFSPYTDLTRAQMITVIVRASQNLGISHNQSCRKASFTDYNRNSNEWYSEYVNYAIDNCILVGYDPTTLGIEDKATTNQIYTVVDRALRYHEEGYKCNPDVVSDRKDSPWDFNGKHEAAKDHKCTRQEPGTTSGAKHVIYDEVGNKTTCEDITLKLDAQKPKCSVSESNITYDNGTKWTKSSTIQVTKSCDDSTGSGCHDGVDSLTSNSKCNTQTDSKTYNYSGSSYKKWTGYACSTKSNSSGIVVDNVGNKSDTCPARSIGIDHENPTCNITDNGHNGQFTRSSVSVDGLCTDGGSGCTTPRQNIVTYYSDDNSSHPHSYTAYDNVGNYKSCNRSYYIRIDNTPPTGSCRASGSVDGYGNQYVSYTNDSVRDYAGSYTGVGGVNTYYGYLPDDSCYDKRDKNVKGYAQLCDSLGNCTGYQQCNGNVTVSYCCSQTYSSWNGRTKTGSCTNFCGSNYKPVYYDYDNLAYRTGSKCSNAGYSWEYDSYCGYKNCS